MRRTRELPFALLFVAACGSTNQPRPVDVAPKPAVVVADDHDSSAADEWTRQSFVITDLVSRVETLRAQVDALVREATPAVAPRTNPTEQCVFYFEYPNGKSLPPPASRAEVAESINTLARDIDDARPKVIDADLRDELQFEATAPLQRLRERLANLSPR